MGILSDLLSNAMIFCFHWVKNLMNTNEEFTLHDNTSYIWNKFNSFVELMVRNLPTELLSVYTYLLFSVLHENDEIEIDPHESVDTNNQRKEESNDSLSSNEKAFRKCLIQPNKIKASFTSIGGLQKEIKSIKRSLLPIIEYEITAKLNSSLMQSPGGILLYGPPGCGKTLMAKALAKEIGINFLNIKSSDIKCSLYGKTEAKITAMFSYAEKIQPVIAFIDEIDSLLRSRSNEASNELSVTRGIKNLFMQHMDGLLNNEKKQIVVIGATNRKEDIDAAILRRMYPHILIDYPNTEERKEIFESILKNEQLDPNIDILKLTEETNGFSGSEIRDICKTTSLNILEEVVNNLKHKQVQVERNPEKESEYICRQMINDVLQEMCYNQQKTLKENTQKRKVLIEHLLQMIS